MSTHSILTGQIRLDARALAVFKRRTAAWMTKFDVENLDGGGARIDFGGQGYRNLSIGPALLLAQLAGNVHGEISEECTDGTVSLMAIRLDGRAAIGGIADCLYQNVLAGRARVVELVHNVHDCDWTAAMLDPPPAVPDTVSFEPGPTLLTPARDAGVVCPCGGYDDETSEPVCANDPVRPLPAVQEPLAEFLGEYPHESEVTNWLEQGRTPLWVAKHLAATYPLRRLPIWPAWNTLIDATVHDPADLAAAVALAPAGLVATIALSSVLEAAPVPWPLLAGTCWRGRYLPYGEHTGRWSAAAERWGGLLLERWVSLIQAGMPDVDVDPREPFEVAVAANVSALTALDEESHEVALTLFEESERDCDRDEVLASALALVA